MNHYIGKRPPPAGLLPTEKKRGFPDRKVGHRHHSIMRLGIITLGVFLFSLPANAEKPVKVYIFSGSLNMLGFGLVSNESIPWGQEFQDAEISFYEEPYKPKTNYDKLKPIKTEKPQTVGTVNPSKLSQGKNQVLRAGFIAKETGSYEITSGLDGAENIVEIDGIEVFRKEVGKDPIRKLIKLTAGKKVPIKITYLTETPTTHGWLTRLDRPGALHQVVKKDKSFSYLIDKSGDWIKREDVWYQGLITGKQSKWLEPGCGATSAHIGPELSFGHLIGDHHDEPVLLIKASQGNRSLGWDYLPPGSERFEYEGKIYAGFEDMISSWKKDSEPLPEKWYAGKQYDDCVEEILHVLENFDTQFPHWKGRGHEIAGFVWWQGQKDSLDSAHTERYEQNLVHLIKTLRKEFKVPDAPFVVATNGQDGWKMKDRMLKIVDAQLALSGEKDKYPEFKGNVKTVETRDFWRESAVSPKPETGRYNFNAETHILVGEAMARAMIELQDKK